MIKEYNENQKCYNQKDLNEVFQILENQKHSILIFLDKETTSSSIINSIFQIQTKYSNYFKIFLFSTDCTKFDEIQALKAFYFLDPPFATIYGLSQKLLEIDLRSNCEKIEEIIKTYLSLENEDSYENFELLQRSLEILFFEKTINGIQFLYSY